MKPREPDTWQRLGAVAARVIRRYVLPAGQCSFCDQHRGGMCPPHDASPNCESGKHTHCTCDVCF